MNKREARKYLGKAAAYQRRQLDSKLRKNYETLISRGLRAICGLETTGKNWTLSGIRISPSQARDLITGVALSWFLLECRLQDEVAHEVIEVRLWTTHSLTGLWVFDYNGMKESSAETDYDADILGVIVEATKSWPVKKGRERRKA